jgi:hypothetical protein
VAWRGRGLNIVVIEAGVVTAYVIAWALRKARRVGDRLNIEADGVIDAGLDRLHEIVENKLGGHPVLAELVEEAGEAGDGEQITDLTRLQLELALTAAAKKDDIFAQMVTGLVEQLQDAEQVAGKSVIAGSGSTVFSGNAKAAAGSGGIAIGQAGSVAISGRSPAPPQPGRISR